MNVPTTSPNFFVKCKSYCNNLKCGGFNNCGIPCNIKKIKDSNKYNYLTPTFNDQLRWKIIDTSKNFSQLYSVIVSDNLNITFTPYGQNIIYNDVITGQVIQDYLVGDVIFINGGNNVIQDDLYFYLDLSNNTYISPNNNYISITPINCNDSCLTFINDDNNCGYCGNVCADDEICCGQKCIKIDDNETCDMRNCQRTCTKENTINCGGSCISKDRVYDNCQCTGNLTGDNCDICLNSVYSLSVYDINNKNNASSIILFDKDTCDVYNISNSLQPSDSLYYTPIFDIKNELVTVPLASLIIILIGNLSMSTSNLTGQIDPNIFSIPGFSPVGLRDYDSTKLKIIPNPNNTNINFNLYIRNNDTGVVQSYTTLSRKVTVHSGITYYFPVTFDETKHQNYFKISTSTTGKPEGLIPALPEILIVGPELNHKCKHGRCLQP